MMVENHGSRIEAGVEACPERRRGSINVFTGKPRAGAQIPIEPTNPLERLPAERKIGALQRSCRQKPIRRKRNRILTLVDRDGSIFLVVQQDPTANAAGVRIIPEGINQRIDEIRLNITVIVREGDDWRTGFAPCGVTRGS
jgi:hypothetical protein